MMTRKFAALFLSLFVVGCALFACAPADAGTAPDWVANLPGTGFLTVHDSAIGDRVLSEIEITTTTAAVSFTVWTANAARDDLVLLKPTWGHDVGDTVITVPAYTTKAYKFPGVSKVWGIYVSAGDGYFSGE